MVDECKSGGGLRATGPLNFLAYHHNQSLATPLYHHTPLLSLVAYSHGPSVGPNSTHAVDS